MNIPKYIFKPYVLIVNYFGCISCIEMMKDEVCGKDIHPDKPVPKVFRFWTERGLRKFARGYDVQRLADEGYRTFTCAYYQS